MKNEKGTRNSLGRGYHAVRCLVDAVLFQDAVAGCARGGRNGNCSLSTVRESLFDRSGRLPDLRCAEPLEILKAVRSRGSIAIRELRPTPFAFHERNLLGLWNTLSRRIGDVLHPDNHIATLESVTQLERCSLLLEVPVVLFGLALHQPARSFLWRNSWYRLGGSPNCVVSGEYRLSTRHTDRPALGRRGAGSLRLWRGVRRTTTVLAEADELCRGEVSGAKTSVKIAVFGTASAARPRPTMRSGTQLRSRSGHPA